MINDLYKGIDPLTLPSPNVIESAEFETIFNERLALFQSLAPQYTVFTEADPVVKVLQACSYRELILRERINNAAKARLLSFASAADLEHLGLEHGVQRLEGESDSAFRYRIQLRCMAQSAAGSEYHYRYHALSADPRVRDAAVYSPDHPNGYNMGGRVYVAVLSHEAGLIPSVELMDLVRARMLSKQVRMVTDILEVEPAVYRSVNVTASVTLLPSTPYAIFQNLAAALRAKFSEVQSLGRDVTRSWLFSALHVPGVHSIELASPVADTLIPPNEFPVLGDIVLTFRGFSDREGNDVTDMERIRLNRLVYEYYVKFAVENLRTQAQIQADLAEQDTAGIIQPTVRGLCTYLNITTTKDLKGNWLPEDELALLVYLKLSKQYTTSPA